MALAPASERGILSEALPLQGGIKPFWSEANAVREFLELPVSEEWNYNEVPPGDGSPVLVLPGFSESDFMHTVPIRSWLGGLGYSPHSSGISLFLAPNIHFTQVDRVSRDIFEKEGIKINIVGHSMGGVLARRIVRNNPKIFRSVVTISTPFTQEERGRPLEGIKQLNVYTKDDGVVNWSRCSIDGENIQNEEIHGTHSGELWNHLMYGALGNFLAEVSKYEEIEAAKKRLPFPVSSKAA